MSAPSFPQKTTDRVCPKTPNTELCSAPLPRLLDVVHAGHGLLEAVAVNNQGACRVGKDFYVNCGVVIIRICGETFLGTCFIFWAA